MSDNWLQFIPADPQFWPSAEAAEDARRLLMSFVPQADEVSADIKETIQFFDPGGNWSGVECPSCGADAESWWGDAMDAAAEHGFENLRVAAGCCGANVSLNELRYLWPAAFGKFALEAMNPNIKDLSPAQKTALEQALGCTLRTVWRHL